MSKDFRSSAELFEIINNHFEDLKTNHNENIEKGNKAAAGRARKAIGEIRKLVTEYRKASIEENR